MPPAGMQGSGQDPYRTRHDWDDGEDISTSVIEAVAIATDSAPTDLTPLFDSIDPDALDCVLSSLRRNDGNAVSGEIGFAFDGTWVTVWSDGTIEVELT